MINVFGECMRERVLRESNCTQIIRAEICARIHISIAVT